MVSTVFCFFITLMILIVVHEAGHFLVARWCGVKVLRFSFGFGRVLAAWRDKQGTEYTWSLLPLGGYVKLLDDNEGPVARTEWHRAFNRQSLWVRTAIILAGPLFNFLFAFLMLWSVAVIGIQSFAPRIDHVKPGSIAALAQVAPMQEVVALDGKKIGNWRDVHYTLMPLLGSNRSVSLTVKALHDAKVSEYHLSLAQWTLDARHPDLLDSLGIVPLLPKLPVVIDFVSPQSPAQLAGFVTGDEVLAVDHHPISDWVTLSDYVKFKAGTDIVVDVCRAKKLHTLVAHLPVKASENGGLLGIGARPQKIPLDWLRLERSTPLDAIAQAWRQTISLTAMTCALIGRTIIGHLPLDQLSGPVGIAKAAGESLRIGWVYYLFFMALLSISIGVLNLLPIPMLDGGHLLYDLIELFIRRPLTKTFKMNGVYVGLGLIILLTLIALLNDLT